MACKKSCTKFTWAEAKAKVGGGDNRAKPKTVPKKLNQIEKVIAKGGAGSDARQAEKRAARKEQRAVERAAAYSQSKKEERQRRKAIPRVRPFLQAREARLEKTLQLQQQEELELEQVQPTYEDMTEETKKLVAECKAMQVQEIFALQAILVEENEFSVTQASRLEELSEAVELYQMDEENEDLLQAVVDHPPLQLLLQLDLVLDLPPLLKNGNGNNNSSSNNANEEEGQEKNDEEDNESGDDELVAVLLLRITLPGTYPLQPLKSMALSPWRTEVAYDLVTNRNNTCRADKPLVSLAHLDETQFQTALAAEARDHVLPDPAVYEVAVTWLTEHATGFYRRCAVV